MSQGKSEGKLHLLLISFFKDSKFINKERRRPNKIFPPFILKVLFNLIRKKKSAGKNIHIYHVSIYTLQESSEKKFFFPMWELMIRVKFRIPFDLPLVFLSSSSSLFSSNLLHKDWVLKKEKHHTFCRQREVRDEMKEQTRRENKNHCFLSSSSMMRCVASENCCTINGPWSSRFASQKAIEEERRKSERKVWNRETRHGKKERKSSSFCTRVVEIQETSFRDWRKTRRLTSVYSLSVLFEGEEFHEDSQRQAERNDETTKRGGRTSASLSWCKVSSE